MDVVVKYNNREVLTEILKVLQVHLDDETSQVTSSVGKGGRYDKIIGQLLERRRISCSRDDIWSRCHHGKIETNSIFHL